MKPLTNISWKFLPVYPVDTPFSESLVLETIARSLSDDLTTEVVTYRFAERFVTILKRHNVGGVVAKKSALILRGWFYSDTKEDAMAEHEMRVTQFLD